MSDNENRIAKLIGMNNFWKWQSHRVQIKCALFGLLTFLAAPLILFVASKF